MGAFLHGAREEGAKWEAGCEALWVTARGPHACTGLAVGCR